MPCWPGKNKKKAKRGKNSANSTVILVSETNSLKKVSKTSLRQQWILSHPMEALKIVQAVFSYMPVNEILNARFVCKRWNSAACTILRDKIEGAVILHRGLSYYSRVMGRSLDIPVGRLFLKIDDMDDPAAIKFFQIIGPSIIYLVLNLAGGSFAGFLRQIHNLTNLKQLSVNLFQEESDEYDKNYRTRKATSIRIFIDDYDNPDLNSSGPGILENLESFVMSCEPEWRSNEAILLEKLLQMSPNVKNVNLTKWPFQLKSNIFKMCSFENLTFLALKFLDEQAFKTLAAKKLNNMKTIECELAVDVHQDTFSDFLNNVASTMEYMELRSQNDLSLIFELTSIMKELKTIRLSTWVGPVCVDSIVANAPRLEKLQLSHVNPVLMNFKDTKTAPCVKYLAVNFGNGSHPMKKIFKTLKNFVAVFPNLKTFMMKKVSDKVMEIICEGWPKLEALRITISFSLTDSGITGIPMSDLQRITKIENRLKCDCCVPVPVIDGHAQLENVRVTPNISWLKNLKDLRIEAEHGTHWSLSNYSLHLGIDKLKELVSLKLTCQELGPHWCLRFIADNLPSLEHLTIMDRAISHDRYDEQELHYLLRKRPNLSMTFAEAGA